MMPLWKPIPGESPIDDISGLKISGISTRKELNFFEANNITNAVLKYLASKPTRRSARFDFSWSLKLHREMFGEVWKWAGITRKSEKTIGVPWTQVDPMLYSLLEDLAHWEREPNMNLLEQAMLLHHRAVQIHPFENGNGRWSRLLANIWLKLHGHPLTEWPETRVGEKSTIRDEYLDAVRQADNGKYSLLRDLHRRFTPAE